MPQVTICGLLYGDHPELARQCLESIRTHCPALGVSVDCRRQRDLHATTKTPATSALSLR